jgi:hypothetical protein
VRPCIIHPPSLKGEKYKGPSVAGNAMEYFTRGSPTSAGKVFLFCLFLENKKNWSEPLSQVLVAHAYNPSYFGDEAEIRRITVPVQPEKNSFSISMEKSWTL